MPTPPLSQATQSYNPATYVQPEVASAGFFSGSLQSVEDAALGIGTIFSNASGFLLPGDNASRAAKILSGSFRGAGGLLTAATSGYRVVKTFMNEYEAESPNYPQTRKEVVVTAGSVSAGLGVGALAGAATSVAALVGAPAIVVGGIVAAGVLGAGYAAYATRDYLSSWYDSW